jgi:hypothetical protein
VHLSAESLCSMTQAILTFIGGLLAGYILAFFKYVFDAEKSRYDFRIKIQREVWEAVLLAKSLAANLDPELGFADPTEPRKERIDRRLKEFGEAHVPAKRVVRFNSPFYPVAIHDLANRIVNESELLARHVANFSPETLEDRQYWKRIREFTGTLNEMTNELDEAIRHEANRPSLNPSDWFRRRPARAVSKPAPTSSESAS